MAHVPALPGERVVAFVNNLGLLRGVLRQLDYGNYDARILPDNFGDRVQSAYINDVCPEAIYDRLIEMGWTLDRLHYRLQRPDSDELMSLAAAADWYRDNQPSEIPGFPPLETLEFETVTIEEESSIPDRFYVVLETTQGWMESGYTYLHWIVSLAELQFQFPTIYEALADTPLSLEYKVESRDQGIYKYFRRDVWQVDQTAWESQTLPPGIEIRIENWKRLMESK